MTSRVQRAADRSKKMNQMHLHCGRGVRIMFDIPWAEEFEASEMSLVLIVLLVLWNVCGLLSRSVICYLA